MSPWRRWRSTSSKLAFTISAVSGVPSENVTSSRRWKVNSVASSLTSHDSASHGINLTGFRILLERASRRADAAT